MARDDGNKEIRCSFCGKTQDQVNKLIAGPGVYICDECVELCSDIIDEDDYPRSGAKRKQKQETAMMDLPKPEEINRRLHEYVIGQD